MYIYWCFLTATYLTIHKYDIFIVSPPRQLRTLTIVQQQQQQQNEKKEKRNKLFIDLVSSSSLFVHSISISGPGTFKYYYLCIIDGIFPMSCDGLFLTNTIDWNSWAVFEFHIIRYFSYIRAYRLYWYTVYCGTYIIYIAHQIVYGDMYSIYANMYLNNKCCGMKSLGNSHTY